MSNDQPARHEHSSRHGRPWLALLLGLGMAIACLAPLQSSALLPETAQKPIIERALQFITLLDQGSPQQAWATTASYFRSTVTSQRWQQIYERQRQPLGAPIDRRIEGYRFLSTFERALDGLYLEIRFRTVFRNAEATERIVMYKDYDGRWRPIGYYLERN